MLCKLQNKCFSNANLSNHSRGKTVCMGKQISSLAPADCFSSNFPKNECQNLLRPSKKFRKEKAQYVKWFWFMVVFSHVPGSQYVRIIYDRRMWFHETLVYNRLMTVNLQQAHVLTFRFWRGAHSKVSFFKIENDTTSTKRQKSFSVNIKRNLIYR